MNHLKRKSPLPGEIADALFIVALIAFMAWGGAKLLFS